MHVLGFDVGFSDKKRSSGIARFTAETLSVNRTTAEWSAREPFVRNERPYEVVAIDAPLVPEGSDGERACEKLFIAGAFQKRCKPGLSHVQGTGAKLREAGRVTADQIRPFVARTDMRAPFPRVYRAVNIVEAFPNAYLGVLLSEDEFSCAPHLKRGRKFDWLYDRCVATNVFSLLLDGIGMRSPELLVERLGETRNHDERAALICLLTAAGVRAGRYTAIGDVSHGYFFLPELSRWQQWATDALWDSPVVRSTEIWANGRRTVRT